jgi:hypothetical protein
MQTGGDRWHISTVKRLLSNTSYAGRAEAFKWLTALPLQGDASVRRRNPKTRHGQRPSEDRIQLPGRFPRVSTRLHSWLQPRCVSGTLLHRRATKKREYRLSGHVVCGWCRKRYAATTIHDQPYSYSTGKRNTRCPGKRNTVRGERCDNLVANGVVLEADVWARVDAFLSDPSLVAAEVERQQGDSGLAGGLASDLARIDQALQRFAGQEQRLITLFRFGEVDEAMITRELTASVRTVRSCKVSARTW